MVFSAMGNRKTRTIFGIKNILMDNQKTARPFCAHMDYPGCTALEKMGQQ
jgi:hypothetical protein